MSRGSAVLLTVALLLGAAYANDAAVLVHQFESQDVLLGTALAAEVADSLDDTTTVIGPEVASASVPPLVVEGGFINPGRLVAAGAMYRPAGADLLRTASGVDVAVTGYVEQRDDRLSLFVSVSHAGGLRTGELTSDPAEPGRLALMAGALVGSILDDLYPDEAPHYTRPADPPALTGGFDSPYGAYVRGIALASAGLQNDALAELESAVGEDGVPQRAEEVLADLTDVVAAQDLPVRSPTSAARLAYLAVQTTSSDVTYGRLAFRQMYEETGLSSAKAWEAALAASVNDRAAAVEAYEVAADYEYGLVAEFSFLDSRGEDPSAAAIDDLISDEETGSAALLAAAVAFDVRAEQDRQVAALEALNRASPFLSYPLEALSYIHFDRGDGRAAAEALAVAVELEPESALYWTNLGWAYYLIGALEASEEASQSALALDGTQSVAAYNLGLVRAVTGRLQAAMPAYEQAMRFDPEVNDEAVEDLENARLLYPNAVEVDYALARLLEAEGRRQDARDAYRRFVRRAGAELGEYAAAARERLVELEQPLPPMEIVGDLRLTLGQRGPEAEPFHPGDPLHPAFELSTAGDELPGRVDVTAEIRPEGEAGEALQTVEQTVEVPPGAVGFVVDQLGMQLPADLAPGLYTVSVTATGGEGQSAEVSRTLEVAGEPEPLRQLIGRNLVMTNLQSGQPLYAARDLTGSADLVEVLIDELRFSAEAAEAALPEVEGGRFDGMSGGEVFTESTAEDVRAFLGYLLSSESRDTRFAFVDAYAQWAIDGAPETPAAPAGP